MTDIKSQSHSETKRYVAMLTIVNRNLLVENSLFFVENLGRTRGNAPG